MGFVGHWLLAMLVFCGCLVMPLDSLAAENTQRFDAANKLYEQGKYAEAIASYREMIKAGEASAAVYFNLGNAHYKAAQVGEAVASYRLAQRLAPRDPEVQANLRFVQEAAGIRIGPPVPWWQAWTQRLSVHEWACLTASAIWLWALFGVLRILKPALAGSLKIPGSLALLAVLLAGGGAAVAWQGTYGQDRAVVKVKETVVRYGPLDDSQSAFTLSDGAEVIISDTKDGWWRVKDGQERTGWVKAETVVRLEEF